MISLQEELHQIRDALDDLSLPWALVGGLAVSARAFPRFTADVDVVVAVADDSEAEELVFALRNTGFVLRELVEQHAVHRLATARLTCRASSGTFVDLLFASSGIEADIAEAAEPLEILPGLIVPVAQAGHLLSMKLLSRDIGRPHDQADVISLIAIMDDVQWDIAADAASTIENRGFQRGRDLRADVAHLRQAASPPSEE